MDEEMMLDEQRGFIIDNDEKAEWALKKIKEANEEHDRLQMLIDKEISALKDKQEKIDVQLDSATGYLKHLLDNYMNNVKCKETKTQKSYQLLTGKLIHKHGTVQYNRDKDALVEWAMKNRPLLIKTTFDVDWASLKKELAIDENGLVMTADGEILDCVKVSKSDDSFDIKW